MKMNHSNNENFDRVINALKSNALELAKTYTALSNNEDYEFLIKIDFLKKDEAHLNHLLCSVQNNTYECFKEDLELFKKYEETYIDEKVNADLIIDSQININRELLNSISRYVEHLWSNLPKSVLFTEFELLRYRATLFTLNDDIIKLHCNSKIFLSINNEKKNLYLALSKLYYRKAELFDSILASDKKLDEIPDVIKLFLIIRKIHVIEKILNKARQNYELTEKEENSIEVILKDDFSFENREFVIDEVRKEINELKDVFNHMISLIQDFSLDIFDDSANRIKRIIKVILDALLLCVNINLYYTKMD